MRKRRKPVSRNYNYPTYSTYARRSSPRGDSRRTVVVVVHLGSHWPAGRLVSHRRVVRPSRPSLVPSRSPPCLPRTPGWKNPPQPTTTPWLFCVARTYSRRPRGLNIIPATVVVPYVNSMVPLDSVIHY